MTTTSNSQHTPDINYKRIELKIQLLQYLMSQQHPLKIDWATLLMAAETRMVMLENQERDNIIVKLQQQVNEKL
jgi:hypothetical protein